LADLQSAKKTTHADYKSALIEVRDGTSEFPGLTLPCARLIKLCRVVKTL